MKKKILLSLLCLVCMFIITGCGSKKEEEKSMKEELNSINDKISEYFSSNDVDYNNLVSHFVDEENEVIVVTLINNSEEEQEWFRKNVVDSKLIKFVQGENHFEDFEQDDITDEEQLIIDCIESTLGGYITSELITPYEIELTDLIDVDMSKVNYSKVKMTDNGFIYVVLDTKDENIKNALKNYMNENYEDYKYTVYKYKYLIYVSNKSNNFNLDNDLGVLCSGNDANIK